MLGDVEGPVDGTAHGQQLGGMAKFTGESRMRYWPLTGMMEINRYVDGFICDAGIVWMGRQMGDELSRWSGGISGWTYTSTLIHRSWLHSS